MSFSSDQVSFGSGQNRIALLRVLSRVPFGFKFFLLKFKFWMEQKNQSFDAKKKKRIMQIADKCFFALNYQLEVWISYFTSVFKF